ncbi:AraC family transcriptional regulator [Clostridium grantii]|uniref:AraC-type DNA-binding protein n=1 Tax=Clostridium grantii DSM 8605 TaxID=1121316 RepID=A0A1M5U3J3_9CLOT|nr:AraC family transcriptional regulator [Clostridium grantii]SHH57592.1 AraC-type DNA-binding protein [Clostridium grantii DSM 8605]
MHNETNVNYFDNIYVKKLICRKNFCSPDWAENNCVYGYNKFYYFLQGEGVLIINGDKFIPKPEELYLIPANTIHSYYHNPNNPIEKYWCHFNLVLNKEKKFIYSKESTKCKISKEKITPLLDKLVSLDFSTNPLDTLTEKAGLLEILKIFLDNVDMKKILPSTFDEFENTINTYIKNNITKDITLTNLADIVHLHPNYFIKYFKKHFSTTPIEYVNSMKLQMATYILINEPDKSISNIAMDLGFNDYRYFSRLFKKMYGITPSNYKNSIG